MAAKACLLTSACFAGVLDMHRELSTLTLRIVTQGVFGSQLPSDISSDEGMWVT